MNPYVILFLVIAALAVITDLAYKYIPKFHAKADAEVALLREQAGHIRQTAAAEALNAEKTIKAYEQQGANKFRTELARLATDLKAVEAKLGFKVSGAIAVDDPRLQVARDLTAKVEVLPPIGNSSISLGFPAGPTPSSFKVETVKAEPVSLENSSAQ